MKRLTKIFMSLAFLATCSMSYGLPNVQKIQNVTLINHYGAPILFEVNRNPEVVPSLPAEFTLENNGQISSKVLKTQVGADEAYIRFTSGGPHIGGFFGIDTLQIYGYMGQGVAYSWDNQEHTTIIFCTTQEYNQKGHC